MSDAVTSQTLSDNQILLILEHQEDTHRRTAICNTGSRSVSARLPWTQKRLLDTLNNIHTLLPEIKNTSLHQQPKTPVHELAQLHFTDTATRVSDRCHSNYRDQGAHGVLNFRFKPY